MADAVFSAVVGDAVSRVISLLTGHLGQQQSTEAKLQRICRMLIRIHSVVEEAKGKHIKNHGTLQWLSELIDSEYHGRYLLDTMGCSEHELQDLKHGEKVAVTPQTSLSRFNPAKRIRVAACTVKSFVLRCNHDVEEIDRVIETLQGVSGDLGEFIMLLQLQGCKPIRRPLATNIFIEGQMFGRHVEKETIINFLLHEMGGQSSGELSVLPIVGDNGVGKKTLVHHACDDARVRNHFPIIMFLNFCSAYVGLWSTYSVVTKGGTSVLRYKHVDRDDAGKYNEAIDLVTGNFRCKRFLMVFEDVDISKKHILEELLPRLRCGGKKGSKIIFTTKHRHIATLGTVEPIKLKVLSCPEFWFLFKAHAFAGRDVEENPSLVAAGKAIARKLNRSFFRAKIIGELLKDRPDPKFWCKILRSNIGGLSQLDYAVHCLADLVENLWPSSVNLYQVCISKTPSISQIELARFWDLCDPHPHDSESTITEVLLCKTMLPFCNIYYTGSCTVCPKTSC